MANLTVAERAKAYDEVFERAKHEYEAHKSFTGFGEMLAHIFPELKEETEDEKVKRILHSISSKMSLHHDIFTEEEFQCFDTLSNDWLKTLDEHNWRQIIRRNKEDEKNINDDSLECDDEKIREALIEYFGEQCDMSNWNGVYGYQVYNWLQKQGEQKENATRNKITKYLTDLILDQSQRGFPMLNYEGRVEEEVDFIINIAKEELKKSEHQKPAHKEYTFTAIPRLLEMIQPNERAKSYCQKLIDRLEQEGYSTDANIVRERLMLMNGEDVPMATMDEQKHKEWNEEDSRKIGTLSSIIFDYAFHKDALDENNDLTGDYAELNDWLGELEKRFNIQTKQEWGEEDEEILQGIWDEILANKHDAKEYEWKTYDKFLNWLKSIADRIQPQSKQEWSEEDSTKMQRIIDFLWRNRKGDTDTIYQQEQNIEWLKSLKNKMTNEIY